eukprot:CAMPEP_0181344894 /NCGR_PEP_ID=MMETSP1101-20121128/32448_1 /TAXON_ID=46948 /ORGANISM="Rhodomonas abbreviata, Strain Caron Lab Isolate" /LENGTH=141 /DNA_ID=CAMNT_0023456791 /DNA_START=70 /DNA_END=492 /DNA_ORIENTATION=+
MSNELLAIASPRNVDNRRKHPDPPKALALVRSTSIRSFKEALQIDTARHATRRFTSEFADKGIVGTGGFGKVYRVHHYVSDKEYAVKKILIKRSNMAEIEKLIREVRMLAKLDSHGNVVRYYNAWLEPAGRDDFSRPRGPA